MLQCRSSSHSAQDEAAFGWSGPVGKPFAVYGGSGLAIYVQRPLFGTNQTANRRCVSSYSITFCGYSFKDKLPILMMRKFIVYDQKKKIMKNETEWSKHQLLLAMYRVDTLEEKSSYTQYMFSLIRFHRFQSIINIIIIILLIFTICWKYSSVAHYIKHNYQ